MRSGPFSVVSVSRTGQSDDYDMENANHFGSDDCEQWRAACHEAVDWALRYLKQVEEFPVVSPREPGETRRMLPATAPLEGESIQSVWEELDNVIVPGLMHWQSPSFFGYFPANNSPPSMIGEWLSATLGVQGMLWSTSPACTELESLVLDWLVDLLHLPAEFRTDNTGGGVIQDSASSATLCAMIAARDRATDGRCRTGGVREPITIYTSSDAHSSVDKAAMICGIGSDHVRRIAVDEKRRISVDSLKHHIEQDVADGAIPAMVSTTIGTTATGAVDDIQAVADACRAHNIWLHVDAAMMGSAAISPRYKFLHDGVDAADSYCFNPHKWLLVNFDCDCFYVRDRRWLTRSLSVHPEYLRNDATESGEVIDYRDWQVPLGRRFRSLKLWLVLKLYGVRRLQAFVEAHCQLAEDFASWVEQQEALKLFDRQLNLVTFSHVDGNDASAELLRAVNRSGRAFLTHAKVDDLYVIRVSIGQRATTAEHVGALQDLLLRGLEG